MEKYLTNRANLSQINSYLIILLAFCITVSVSATSITIALIGLIFLFEREYVKRLSILKSNPLTYLILLYFLMHLVGLAWSEDFTLAKESIGRSFKILFILLLMMYTKKEHIFYYLQSFLLGMFIAEVLTYLVWFDILEPFKQATHQMPSPLMKHTYYTPFVAMACAVLINFLLFKEYTSKLQKALTILFLATMIFNLFITGGRGGQVGFFVLLLVLLSFKFKHNLLKALLAFSFISCSLFYTAYTFIPLFEKRADKAIDEIISFEPGVQNTSLGLRLAFNKNYFEIVKQNPIFGVGTGDYLKEYEKINEKSLYKTNISQPHNMYLLILSQFGIVGGAIFLSIFIYQIILGIRLKDQFQALRLAFPLFFLVIMLVNWYLYTHHTMYLFIFFSALFYSHRLCPKE